MGGIVPSVAFVPAGSAALSPMAFPAWDGGGAKPPSISYAASPFMLEKDAAMTAASPANAGGPVNPTGGYTVASGSLPAGVSLNADTGALTGTPTATQAAGSVTIRATGPAGTSDVVVSFEVYGSLAAMAVAYYELDGDMLDASFGGHDMEAQGTSPTFSSAAAPDGVADAMLSDPADGHAGVESANAAFNGVGESVYISAWYKADQLPSDAGEAATLIRQYSGYWLYIRNGDNKLVAQCNKNGGGVMSAVSSAALSDTNWHFYEMLWDQGNEELSVAIDGGAWQTVSHASAEMGSTNNPPNVGGIFNGGGSDGLTSAVGLFFGIPTSAHRTYLAAQNRSFANVKLLA